MPTIPLPSAAARQYAYLVIVALLGVLVAFKAIAPDVVPSLLSLAEAVLGLTGVGMAATALARQRRDGTLE